MAVEKLGKRIKKYRENLEMSREDLAATTGLELGDIVALEDENLYPSIGPLQKVARALKVRLGTFMDDVSSADPVINRASEREADLTMQKNRNKKASYSYHSLSRGKTDRNMEPFFVEISPEANQEAELSSHEGEEFIVVVSGRLKLTYGKDVHILEAGDSTYYNSIVPHHVGTADDKPCSIHAVIYYP